MLLGLRVVGVLARAELLAAGLLRLPGGAGAGRLLARLAGLRGSRGRGLGDLHHVLQQPGPLAFEGAGGEVPTGEVPAEAARHGRRVEALRGQGGALRQGLAHGAAQGPGLPAERAGHAQAFEQLHGARAAVSEGAVGSGSQGGRDQLLRQRRICPACQGCLLLLELAAALGQAVDLELQVHELAHGVPYGPAEPWQGPEEADCAVRCTKDAPEACSAGPRHQRQPEHPLKQPRTRSQHRVV
mmetsp:Transcript_49218/g.157415  ORF Transcript_49218/g.157415 Transcript_49218/m.157415 type:complete len:242 (+) Transcript_49218:224-949(+)